uniref:Uncharacterized protein n=1 Tax=Arundo donax TaxID=35708 RepID=A0A0A9BWL4_ARUDO
MSKLAQCHDNCEHHFLHLLVIELGSRKYFRNIIYRLLHNFAAFLHFKYQHHANSRCGHSDVQEQWVLRRWWC